MDRPGNELNDVVAVAVHCEDCGRRKRIGREKLYAFSRAGIRTLAGLGDRLVCSHCRQRGQVDKNISLVPYLRPEIRA